MDITVISAAYSQQVCSQILLNRVLLLACLFSCFIPWSTQAQDSAPAFFERDFAKGVDATGGISKPNSAERLKAGGRETRRPGTLAEDDLGVGALRTKQSDPTQERRVVPPPRILVVVNSKDAEHLARVVRKVLSLTDKGIALIGEIAHIGDYRTLSPELSAALTDAGIAFYPQKLPPYTLPITRSPAWVFIGAGGLRIVEGTFSIERFISPLGQYRDPSWKTVPHTAEGQLAELP